MSTYSVEEEILSTAHDVGSPDPLDDLFDSQMSFWLSVQSLMRAGGYQQLRKRIAFVSEEVAEAIANSSLKSIRLLCSGEISTIKPTLPDTTIIQMLSPEPKPDTAAKMVLQSLFDQEELPAHGQ
ncbi:MAG: hypothetical protein KTR20_05945 [Cellvibrionaceae bacterium]|nr:hypothetical protein [Cellvibrionaceae bacterium]